MTEKKALPTFLITETYHLRRRYRLSALTKVVALTKTHGVRSGEPTLCPNGCGDDGLEVGETLLRLEVTDTCGETLVSTLEGDFKDADGVSLSYEQHDIYIFNDDRNDAGMRVGCHATSVARFVDRGGIVGHVYADDHCWCVGHPQDCNGERAADGSRFIVHSGWLTRGAVCALRALPACPDDYAFAEDAK